MGGILGGDVPIGNLVTVGFRFPPWSVPRGADWEGKPYVDRRNGVVGAEKVGSELR